MWPATTPANGCGAWTSVVNVKSGPRTSSAVAATNSFSLLAGMTGEPDPDSATTVSPSTIRTHDPAGIIANKVAFWSAWAWTVAAAAAASASGVGWRRNERRSVASAGVAGGGAVVVVVVVDGGTSASAYCHNPASATAGTAASPISTPIGAPLRAGPDFTAARGP